MQHKNSQSTILSCRHISKTFNQVEILKDITFTLSKGEKIGLIGPNGAGKTTIFKIIAGLLNKDSGVISRAKNIKIEYLPQFHTNQEHLSGGEIAKKVLAPIVSSNADLFLLDEPTNNLDEKGLKMIEDFISQSSKSFIIISHDRMFLDKVVNKIIEIDLYSKTSTIYDGNYSSFYKQKEELINRQWQVYSDKVEKIDKFNTSIDQRVSWTKKIEKTRKNIKHSPIHEKEKPVAAILRDKEARAGRCARLMKDRLESYKKDSASIEKPLQLPPLHIEFNHERGSTKVFSLKDVTKTVGNRTIGPLNISIAYGERWHITGKNGAGKTTLIKLLLGEIMPNNGIIEKGETIKKGYISQDRWNNNSNKTVLEDFMDVTQLPETFSRKILNLFRITTEDIKKSVTLLSPGEYSRMVIAELVAQSPNCIILDEPSNHLDLEVLTELENGLKEYKGTLIVVSHDRYFVNKLQLDKSIQL